MLCVQSNSLGTDQTLFLDGGDSINMSKFGH